MQQRHREPEGARSHTARVFCLCRIVRTLCREVKYQMYSQIQRYARPRSANRDGQIFFGGRRKRNKKAYFSSAGLAFSVLPDPNPRPAV
jgi:hypothetical protein